MCKFSTHWVSKDETIETILLRIVLSFSSFIYLLFHCQGYQRQKKGTHNSGLDVLPFFKELLGNGFSATASALNPQAICIL